MDPRAALVDRLFARWAKSDSPGCAIGVIQGAKFLYRQGYGMADLEHGVPLTSASVFDLASMSKQFVCACLLLLAEQAKLTLEDDIRQHIPEMPAYERPITIRHLVHHTSGIRDYVDLMSLAGLRFENAYYLEEILALIARQTALNFPPGDRYLYSNSGYLLLGEIVHRVSGQSLGDFARDALFRPLGMDHTCFYDDFTRIVPDRAIGYAPKPGGGYGIELYKNDLVGDGGVLTSVDDLYHWDHNFYGNRLGQRGPALLNQMLTTGVLDNGERLPYAFGLILGEYRGLRIVSHGGSWAGYRSEMIRFPEQQFTAICLSNLATFDSTAMARRIADIYLADQLQPIAEVGGGAATAATPAEADLEARAGAYWDAGNATLLRLAVQEGKLVVHHPAGVDFELVAIGSDRFRSVDAPVALEFEFEAPVSEEPRRLQVSYSDEDEPPLNLLAIEPPALDPDTLAAYAGRYDSSELGAAYHLLPEAGRLTLRVGYCPDRPALEPVGPDAFCVEDKYLAFERGAGQRLTGFRISEAGGGVQNVWFAKAAE